MEKLIDSMPEIIRAAAQSWLGMLALLVIALAALAHLFFSGASERIRVGIFLLLFLAAVSFGVALFRVGSGFAWGGPAATVTKVPVTQALGNTWAGARDQVPVFVTVGGAATEVAAATFREQLRTNGFSVIGSRTKAAVVVELAGEVTYLGPAPYGENLYSGKVTLSLSARWTNDDSTFLEIRRDGNGVSSSAQNAERAAFAKAAELLFARFLEQVEARAATPSPAKSQVSDLTSKASAHLP